jgi:hypothetical protein
MLQVLKGYSRGTRGVLDVVLDEGLEGLDAVLDVVLDVVLKGYSGGVLRGVLETYSSDARGVLDGHSSLSTPWSTR